MHDSCSRLVHNLPAAIEKSLCDSEIRKDFQGFRKLGLLPDVAPNGGIYVREMVETVSHSVSVCRVLHQSQFAVDSIEGVLALERRSRLGKLAAIHSAHSRIAEIGNHALQPVFRGWNRILGEKNEDPSRSHHGRKVSRARVVKLSGKNLRDANRKTAQ